MMNIKTVTITHELHINSEKKLLSKVADRDFKVKLIFKDGIYDDEAIVKGYPNDVSNFIGYFKTMKQTIKTQPIIRHIKGGYPVKDKG